MILGMRYVATGGNYLIQQDLVGGEIPMRICKVLPMVLLVEHPVPLQFSPLEYLPILSVLI